MSEDFESAAHTASVDSGCHALCAIQLAERIALRRYECNKMTHALQCSASCLACRARGFPRHVLHAQQVTIESAFWQQLLDLLEIDDRFISLFPAVSLLCFSITVPAWAQAVECRLTRAMFAAVPLPVQHPQRRPLQPDRQNDLCHSDWT